MFLNTVLSNTGLTKYQIAKKSGLPWSTISDVFSGKNSIEKCNGNTLFELSKVLGCSMEYLILGSKLEEIKNKHENGEYSVKHKYYKDTLSILPSQVVLAYSSAIEYHNMTNGDFSSEVEVYSTENLPYPFIVHKVDSFENIDIEKKDGIFITSLNQTFNDLLRCDKTDSQILFESLGKYYYKNNETFNNLSLDADTIEIFNNVKEEAISYWDEE